MSKATWLKGVVVAAGLAGTAVVFAWDGGRSSSVAEASTNSAVDPAASFAVSPEDLVSATCCKCPLACTTGPGGCGPGCEPQACPCPPMNEAAELSLTD